MAAFLRNDSLFEDDYSISVLDCRKSVGNYDGGDLASQFLRNLINSLLYFFLIGLVQSRSCFIKDQNLRLLNKSTSYGNSLLLSS